MKDLKITSIPKEIPEIEKMTKELEFDMASVHELGSFLRSLASTKPSGDFLELGTGTGLSSCWILDGMDQSSSLTTIDNDPTVIEVAKKYLGHDLRVNFKLMDSVQFIKSSKGRFDFIFADAWGGKYSFFDETINLLKKGGIYIIDDMLPQENWPDGHPEIVKKFIRELENREDLFITKLNWSSGIILITKR